MKKSFRNTAFLIELLINVLVLSIACAILVGVFAQSSLMVSSTGRKNAAGSEIYSLLQTARVEGFDSLGHSEAQPDGSLLLGYDQDWQPAAIADAVYTVKIIPTAEGTGEGTLYDVLAIAYKADGEEICSFTTAIYRGGEAL